MKVCFNSEMVDKSLTGTLIFRPICQDLVGLGNSLQDSYTRRVSIY